MTRLYAILVALAAVSGLIFLYVTSAKEAAVQGVQADTARAALKTTADGLRASAIQDAQSASEVRAAVDLARKSTATARKVLRETKADRPADAPAGECIPDPEFVRVFNDALAASTRAVAAARRVPH